MDEGHCCGANSDAVRNNLAERVSGHICMFNTNMFPC